jgi:hypothetical protein
VIEESCEEEGLDASQIAILLKEFDIHASLYGGAGVCLSEDGDLLSQWIVSACHRQFSAMRSSLASS